MPEQEFEIYLSLLGRLLRLSPAQKAAISDELRDHLEQRLETLMQSGSSRDDAIKVAMEEFGDITGLALDLTKASRTPFRKIAVRSTIAASAVAVLIVGWLSFFVPEHRLASPPVVQAEPPAQPVIVAQEVAVVEKGAAASELAVVHDEELFPEFLAKLTSVSFAEVPFTDVCRHLEELHNVPVGFHRVAFAENGINPNQPVSLVLNGLSFEEVLNHLTNQLGLAWHVDDGLVQITTPEHEECRLLTRQYDLSQLIVRGHTLKTIFQILVMDTDKWQEIHGDGGTAASVGDALIVSQTYHDQRRISLALAAIDAPPSSSVLIGTCTRRDKLLAVLRTSVSVDLDETPLAEVIQLLASQVQAPILINVKALAEDGIDSRIPITVHRKNRTLGRLLDEVLGDLQLDYVIRDGVIQVTTQARADADMKMVAYNLHDLMVSDELFSQLLKAIPRTTTGQWENTDGEGGSLAKTDVGGVLFVKHNDKMQTAVSKLIGQLRQTWQGRSPDAKKIPAQVRVKLTTRSYQMPKDVATDLHSILPRLIAPESWGKMGAAGEPLIEFVTSNPLMEPVDGLVSGGSNEIRVLNPEPNPARKAGEASAALPQVTTSVVVRPRSTLIIRQTAEVHQKIHKFLTSLGVNFEVGVVQQSDGGEVDSVIGGGMGGAIGGGMGGGGLF